MSARQLDFILVDLRAPQGSLQRRRRGFTLVEAAIVAVIIGLGALSLLQLLAAGSMANSDSAQLTTAVFLAENVNEMMQGVSYDALKSTYDDDTYSPPKDGRGTDLSGFSGWSQLIDVSYVDPNAITVVVPDTQVEVTSMVTVRIMHNNQVIYTTKWLVAAPS